MAKHEIMDDTGHSVVDFDKADPIAVKVAMERFEELVGKGYLAATRNAGERDYVVAKSFDETRDETLFRPRRVGG